MTIPASMITATGAALLSLSLATAAEPPGAAAEPEADGATIPHVVSATQPAPAPTPAAEPAFDPDRFYFTVHGIGEATFRTNLDDNPGDVAVYRTGAGLGLTGPLRERLRLSVNLDSEFSWYDFQGAAGLVPGADDPISDAYRLTLRPQLVVIESENLTWFVGGIVQSSGEPGADFGDTITGGGFGGVRCRLRDGLALSIGVGATSRLEDSALIVPLIGVEWKLSDTVTLASEGLGASLNARLNEDWWFTARGGWEFREYRLDSDGPLPDGAFTDTRVPVGVGFSYRPSQAVSIDLLGGAVVWQEFTVHDADGHKLTELNADPTGFIRLTARITF